MSLRLTLGTGLPLQGQQVLLCWENLLLSLSFLGILDQIRGVVVDGALCFENVLIFLKLRLLFV